MNSRNAALGVAVIGGVLLLLGLFADVIGVGDEESFGLLQIAMTIVGALLVALGYFRFTRSSH